MEEKISIDYFSSLLNYVSLVTEETYKKQGYIQIDHLNLQGKLGVLVSHTIAVTCDALGIKLKVEESKFNILKKRIKYKVKNKILFKSIICNKNFNPLDNNLNINDIILDLQDLGVDFNKKYNTNFDFEQVYDLWFPKEKK